MIRRLLGPLVLAGLAANFAHADFYSEIGDAGDVRANSQTTVGATPLEGIRGRLGDSLGLGGIDYQDMFLIQIDDPSGFSAFTVNDFSGALDTQLFLFEINGFGLLANDDQNNPIPIPIPPKDQSLSSIPPGTVSALGRSAGAYYLAVSLYNSDPVSAGGPIFDPNAAFEDVQIADGPGAGQPIIGWTNGVIAGAPMGQYQISLTGARFAVVPEPGSVVLFGLGAVAGLGLLRRRRRAG